MKRAVAEVQQMVEVTSLWSPADRAWWRELIATSPQEALFFMDIVLELDATPIEDVV